MPVKMCRSLPALAALFTVLASGGTSAAPSSLNLVCSGNSYSKLGDPFPTPETVTLATSDTTHVLVGLPGSGKPAQAKIVSSNAIQLKFAAAGLTGEYFNFSGDLFLIHKDGRFTRLACQPKA